MKLHQANGTASSLLHCLGFSISIWLVVFAMWGPAFGQNRSRDIEILQFIKSTVRDYYYDPHYRGIDLEAHFKSFGEKLKQSKSDQESMVILAAALLGFDDSHTLFLPPAFEDRLNLGWKMMMVGESCVVTKVDSQSEAEKQGLKPGDRVLSIDGAQPLRKDLWKIEYLFRYLQPLRVRQLLVQSPGESPHLVTIAVNTEKYKQPSPDDTRRLYEKARQQNVEMVYAVSGEVVLWKVPDLRYYEDKDIDQILGKIKGYKKLILDLRGNPGGYADVTNSVLGCLFNRSLKAYDVKGRKNTQPHVIKPHRKGAFEGDLIAIVDSKSASGAEIIARVIQLEKRGKVIGDLTAGAVMMSDTFTNRYIVNPNFVVQYSSTYGVRVSMADVLMSDGRSLERIGIQPDELLLQKPEDIVGKRDPVLARAAMFLGANLDPSKAWALLNTSSVPLK